MKWSIIFLILFWKQIGRQLCFPGMIKRYQAVYTTKKYNNITSFVGRYSIYIDILTLHARKRFLVSAELPELRRYLNLVFIWDNLSVFNLHQWVHSPAKFLPFLRNSCLIYMPFLFYLFHNNIHISCNCAKVINWQMLLTKIMILCLMNLCLWKSARNSHSLNSRFCMNKLN